MIFARLLLVVSCVLWPVVVAAQPARWEAQMSAAKRAAERHSYGEVEEHLRSALQTAEPLGEDTPEVFLSVSALGSFLFARGRQADAEPFIARALAIRERVLGPEDPAVAESLV